MAESTLPAAVAYQDPSNVFVDQKPEKDKYTLKFEPVGEWSEETLFINGRLRGKVNLGQRLSVIMKSLSGNEVDQVYKAVPVVQGMSRDQYNTEVTYYDLAYSLDSIGDKKMPEKLEDRLTMLRGLAAPILSRLTLAYLEFNARVDELFRGQEALGTAKKS